MFRPLRETPATIIPGAATFITVTGPVVNESQHTYGYISQSTRLWAGATDVEIEWTVGPVDTSDNQGHEVITRFTSNLKTDANWTTDSNCREQLPRRRNYRSQWNLQPTEVGVTFIIDLTLLLHANCVISLSNYSILPPLQAVAINYFPTNCLIKTASPEITFAVGVDRSEGSSSMNDGQLELMVHRRLLHDDGEWHGRLVPTPLAACSLCCATATPIILVSLQAAVWARRSTRKAS